MVKEKVIMKKLLSIFTVFVLLISFMIIPSTSVASSSSLIVSSPCVNQLFRWQENGHYYYYFGYERYRTDAADQAAAMSVHGIHGFLVSINNIAEQVMINNLRVSTGYLNTCWIGLSHVYLERLE